AILQLMEQGKLNLQDEITKFIPDYPTHGYKITIEHLLTHTSGIHSYTAMPDYEERMTLDVTPLEMIEHFKYQPMDFAPGTQWKYSNSGYFLLGYIIEVITEKPYATYITENFFKPLGMTNSFCGNDIGIISNRVGAYSMSDFGYVNAPPINLMHPYAAGNILSTVEDLSKWNAAVHSYKLVKKENIDKAFTRGKLADGSRTDYGYGWGLGTIQDSPTHEHGGGINGSITMEIYLPNEDVFVAVFHNCDNFSPQDIASRLAAITIGKPFEHTVVALDSLTLQDYTGVYENAKGEQRIITAEGTQLFSKRDRNPKFPIDAFAKDKFFVQEGLLELEFVRNKKGKVTETLAHGRKGNEVWTKTNKPIPVLVAIKVDQKILDTYVGVYQVSPEFAFTVSRSQDSLFVQATGQEKFPVYAETSVKFFTLFNDATFEFVSDEKGKVTKVLLMENGQKMEAVRVEAAE
ncbi:MAG TPA: serine hydrolase, partial [Bacteroidia bacterium]|nr:serine hydrolase [Bacteroidia bacterium]